MPDWVHGLRLEKGPGEVLDYEFDWSDWLTLGDTIQSETITVDAGLTKVADAITNGNTAVSVRLAGGTTGASYNVNSNVVTANGQTGDRAIKVRIKKQQ